MLEGEMGGIVKSFQDMIKNSGGVQVIMEKIKNVVHGIAEFFRDLPGGIMRALRGAAHFLSIFAAVQAALGAILVGISFFTGGATAGAGAALLLGAVKTGAIAAAAGYAADKVEQFVQPVTVGGAAAANQAASSPMGTSAATPQTQPNQPVNVYMRPYFTVDGQRLYVQTYENGLSSAPVDNSGGQYFSPKSYSFSGQ
jgi:hypothetical protein